MSSGEIDKQLMKRLLPLYAAAFFQGFVLWYAIEKLFMKTIGFDDATIGVMIAFYSAIMLLAETPSGILADRWSRKGVLALGSVALAISSIIGGLSDNVAVYLLSAAFWGLFFALYSGTYDSIVYDTVLEHTKESSRYEQYYGRIKVVESIALVCGSLLGGLAANYFSLRWAYYLTVPVALLAIVALLRFREPQLHKSSVAVPIKEHVQNTFKAVLRKGQLLPVMVVLVTVSALTYIVFEFCQLWPITLAAPVVLYGPINAIHLATVGVGGAAASYFKLHRYSVMLGALLVMTLSSLGLVFSRNLALVVACIALLCLCLVGFNVVFTRLLHDSLDSKVRAGAASAVSTLGRMIIIPLALGFGYVSKETDIFHASWALVGMVAIIIIFVGKTHTKNNLLPAATQDQGLSIEDYSK